MPSVRNQSQKSVIRVYLYLQQQTIRLLGLPLNINIRRGNNNASKRCNEYKCGKLL
jgi:hypothetical protein